MLPGEKMILYDFLLLTENTVIGLLLQLLKYVTQLLRDLFYYKLIVEYLNNLFSKLSPACKEKNSFQVLNKPKNKKAAH